MWAFQRLTGAEALEWGLATEVSDDPVGRATELAAHLAQLNPAAVRAVKAVVDDAIGLDSAAGLALEAQRSSALLGSPDQVEAVMARLEGRTPDFEG
jgi:enoyl-CoA hydratase/carnithine racemase